MTAVTVVVDLDIFKNDTAHLLPGGNALAVNDLNLHRMEEALGTSIVVAVAFAAHAADQVALNQKCLIFYGAVLAAPI